MTVIFLLQVSVTTKAKVPTNAKQVLSVTANKKPQSSSEDSDSDSSSSNGNCTPVFLVLLFISIRFDVFFSISFDILFLSFAYNIQYRCACFIFFIDIALCHYFMYDFMF